MSYALKQGWERLAVCGALCALVSVAGCEKPASTTAAASTPKARSAEETALAKENEALKAELALLRVRVEELNATPQVLLTRVTQALEAKDAQAASKAIEDLDKRFADSAQTKAAHAQLARYEQGVKEQQELAKRLDAQGFYALKPVSSAGAGGVTLKVESIQMAAQWQFDAYDSEWFYRSAERGERYVVARVSVQSAKDKDPLLPDFAVYQIDGKKMSMVMPFDYKFRRWSSHGTYIGLYHDFKNDFAHSPEVPFTAAASISDEVAKQPFAVVASGELCHSRGSKIGQPEIVYTRRFDCEFKPELSVTDFSTGTYRVLAFFNRPKGT